MAPFLAAALLGAFMGLRCDTAQAPRCVTAQAPRTMRPVAAIQLTPDEQNDIQTELLNLKMSTQKELSILKTRLLSVEKTTEILAYTNRTNGMVKMNMKRNQLVDYDDVSSSALPSPVRARLGRHLHAWPLRARWPLPTPDPRPPPPTHPHPRPPFGATTPPPPTHDPRPTTPDPLPFRR